MRKHICFAILLGALTLASAFAQTPDKASTELINAIPHYHGGDDVKFKIELNEPLPEGAHFDVRFSPGDVNQQVSVGSSESTDKDRKEFLLTLKLPEHARGGDWHIAVVYLFLPGVSWTYSTIATDLKFVVDGPDKPLPTTAVSTFEKK